MNIRTRQDQNQQASLFLINSTENRLFFSTKEIITCLNINTKEIISQIAIQPKIDKIFLLNANLAIIACFFKIF